MHPSPHAWFRLLVLAVALSALAPVHLVAGQTPPPEPPVLTGYRGERASAFSSGESAFYAAIDAYWSATLTEAGSEYRPPLNVIVVRDAAASACGDVLATQQTAFYCGADESIYITTAMIAWSSNPEESFGDYGPFNVLAHEWAHHVQFQLDLLRTPGNTRELQADCMAGAWAQRARLLGLLDKGDVTEAAYLSAASGDDYNMPQDIEGAHGFDDDRITAFMGGFINGISQCELPFSAGSPLGSGSQGAGMDPVDSGSRSPEVTPAPIVLSPTPTPILLSPVPLTPTPTPIGHDIQDASAYLPTSPALAHANCFFLYDEADLDFPAAVSRFTDTPDAQSRLSALGWRDGAFRQFGCDGPPSGTAGWIDVSVHIFADAPAAQAAVPYFAAARIAGTTLRYADAPLLGDATTAVTGPASNGWEYTIYASEGPVLVRVTGVAPAGDPKTDVAAVTADVLAGVTAGGAGSPMVAPTPTTPPVPAPDASVVGMLPDRLAVANAACFLPFSDWRFTREEVVPWLGRAGAPAELVDAWRWQDGANRTLRCALPTSGGASQFDVAVHQFGDAVAARAAEPYLLRGYETGPEEARRCGTAGAVVVCVTGRGVGAPPTGDVEAVLRQVLEGA